MFCFVVARWSVLLMGFVSAEEEGFIRYVIGQPGFAEEKNVICQFGNFFANASRLLKSRRLLTLISVLIIGFGFPSQSNSNDETLCFDSSLLSIKTHLLSLLCCSLGCQMNSSLGLTLESSTLLRSWRTSFSVCFSSGLSSREM